jgi:hypothetical protein
MSSLSSEIFTFCNFLYLSLEKIKITYNHQLLLINWNKNIDDDNFLLIKKIIKNVYNNDNDFFNDISKLAYDDNSDIYTTVLKIIDILDLNESKLDNYISKIFLGFPHFNNCGEAH